MRSRTTTFAFLSALTLSVFTSACTHDLDENTIQPRAEGRPYQLDSEQVSLTFDQVNCGIKDDLWETASADSGQQTRYRLTQKGRDLQFSDDVYSNGPGYRTPYAQVRGKFYLSLSQIIGITDGAEGANLIQGKVGVKIPHECFPTPLPLMAVRNGTFTPEVAPTLKYENTEEGWYPTGPVH